MSSFLIRYTPPEDHEYRDLVLVEGDVYVYAGDSAPEDAQVIGEWAVDGSLVQIDRAAYEAIRPLGNVDGQATGILAYTNWTGYGLREMEPGSLYPADLSPLAIEVRHREFTGEANPAWNGWGWRAEIVGSAGSRDPTARAIGVYRDAGCTDYWYTTGAFSQGPSEWQVDEVGDPLTVWATQYNPAYLGVDTSQKQDHHHAVLLGSAQEGHATLEAGAPSAMHLYWEQDQGYVPPPDADWVDSGATVTGQAGQLYYLSQTTAALGMVNGETIRLGAIETTYTQTWPGTDNLIQITPYVSVTVGTKLYLWR